MTRTGRSGKLTTGNINRGILPRLIFCFRVGGQAIFLEPEGRDGCDCRVMSRSDADGAGPLSCGRSAWTGVCIPRIPRRWAVRIRPWPVRNAAASKRTISYTGTIGTGEACSPIRPTGRRLGCHRCRSAPMTGRGNAGGCSTGPVLVWKRSR